MTQRTSVEAFNTIKENGLLGGMQFQVYEFIQNHGPCTQNEALRHLAIRGKNTGSISTRFSELKRKEVIEECGEKQDEKSGMQTILWRTTTKLPIKFEKPKRYKCPHCNGKGYTQEEQAKLF